MASFSALKGLFRVSLAPEIEVLQAQIGIAWRNRRNVIAASSVQIINMLINKSIYFTSVAWGIRIQPTFALIRFKEATNHGI